MSKMLEKVKNLNYKDLLNKKLSVTVFENKQAASRFIAEEISKLIIQRQKENQIAVLGLATGSTPILVYRELIHMHNQSGLSFQNVITFNLDEYYPMQSTSPHSYHKFMHHYFFSHIDIPKENIHIPDGTISVNEITAYCGMYEKKIKEAGGIDLQILGIGRNGHIGFNEPRSIPNSQTRLVTLDQITRQDAATDFNGFENTPKQAITMGIKTILDARKIYLLAWGKNKKEILNNCMKQGVKTDIPATYLKLHPDASVIIDKSVAYNTQNHQFQIH